MRGRFQKLAKRLRLAKLSINMLKSRIRALRRQLVNIKSVALDILKNDNEKADYDERLKGQLDDDTGSGSDY